MTIKDIGMKGGAITTRVVAFNPHPYEDGGPSRGFVPFAPFRLDPEQGSVVEMEVQVGENACVEGAGFSSWFEEPITYTIFGITRHGKHDILGQLRILLQLVGDGDADGKLGIAHQQAE